MRTRVFEMTMDWNVGKRDLGHITLLLLKF